MMTCRPMLAKEYQGTDPAGWWMSEKLDGVRAIWDCTRFLSRNGRELQFNGATLAAMPPGVVLDGEIYGGPGQFQNTAAMVRRRTWYNLRFMIFDAPREGPFESRIAWAEGAVWRDWKARGIWDSPCAIVAQTECQSRQHLREFEEGILARGGEGVMLRRAGSVYAGKRSPDLLKLTFLATRDNE